MTAAAILKLQRVGFSEEQVEALAGYFDEQLATKADLASGIESVRTELKTAEACLNSTLVQVRGEVEQVRRELKTEAARLEVKIEQARSNTVKGVIGVAVTQAATFLALLRFSPGHS